MTGYAVNFTVDVPTPEHFSEATFRRVLIEALRDAIDGQGRGTIHPGTVRIEAQPEPGPLDDRMRAAIHVACEMLRSYSLRWRRSSDALSALHASQHGSQARAEAAEALRADPVLSDANIAEAYSLARSIADAIGVEIPAAVDGSPDEWSWAVAAGSAALA